MEPIGALLMLVLAEFLGPVLPYFLSFAAGAMIYVVVEELIPESLKESIPMWQPLDLPLGLWS